MINDWALDVVAQAEAYPFGLAEEAAAALAPGGPAPAHLAATVAMVAIGPGQPAPPVTWTAELRGHAVVYAATVTRFGSIPATVVPAAGAVALVPVTLVGAGDLGAWRTAARAAGDVLVDVTPALDMRCRRALAPRSRFGPLMVNGQPLRLAEVPTAGTRFPSAYQTGLLALLHHVCAKEDESYEALLQSLVASSGRRAAVRRRLASGLHTRSRP